MTTYREILKRSWKLSWSPKSIWLFGLLSASLGVGGAITKSLNLTGGQGILLNLWQTLVSANFFAFQTLKNVPNLFVSSPISFIITSIIFLIAAIVAIVIIILAVVSQATIIDTVSKKDAGKKSSYLTGLSLGLDRFWSIFGLNVLVKIVGSVTLVFLAVFAIKATAGKLVFFGFIYFILLLIVFIVTFVIRYAICHLILNNDDFITSLKKGKEIFINNWLTTLEIAFLLFVIEIIILLLARLAITIDSIIFYVIFIAVSLLQATAVKNIIMFLAFFTVTAIALAFISFYAVFSWSVWTILTKELEKKNVFSLVKSWLRIS